MNYARVEFSSEVFLKYDISREAFQDGNPSGFSGKPEGVLEALRKHSVGQTIWGAVKFLDGDRYIAVTRSVNTHNYNDPKGGCKSSPVLIPQSIPYI